AAARGPSRRESQRRDVPQPDLDRLPRLRLRLRFQPDARPAAEARRARPAAPFGPVGGRYRRKPDPDGGPLLRAHRRPWVELRTRAEGSGRVSLPAGAAQTISALPGRICPADYRYDPSVFDRPHEIATDVLYVVGGLYGNLAALDAVERLAQAEHGAATVV